MERPTNLKKLRGLLGVCSYFRKCILNFARHARPLTDLLKNDVSYPKEFPTEQMNAFLYLKNVLTTKTILVHADFSEKFYITTDASFLGLGGYLSQMRDGKEVVIQYVSRTLLPAEKNYTVHKLEILAAVWVIGQFRYYVNGTRFTLRTDRQSLLWLNTHKSPGRLIRYILTLSEYDFDVIHIKGKDNQVADWLSRNPMEALPLGKDHQCTNCH